jgi:hypothetical protein
MRSSHGLRRRADGNARSNAVAQQRLPFARRPGASAYVRLTPTPAAASAVRCWRASSDPFFTTGRASARGPDWLSLVHGIVVDSRGVIDVVTRDGHGTTFTVWLPCRRDRATSAEASEAAPRGNGRVGADRRRRAAAHAAHRGDPGEARLPGRLRLTRRADWKRFHRAAALRPGPARPDHARAEGNRPQERSASSARSCRSS